MLGGGVGASAITSQKSPERTVESFQMIGVNVLRWKGLGRLRGFLERCLILGTLGSSLMGLGPFVLDAYFHPFFRGVGGRPPLPVRITS